MIKVVKTTRIGQYELSYTPSSISLPVKLALLTGLASILVGWLTGYDFDHRDARVAWWAGTTVVLMALAACGVADSA